MPCDFNTKLCRSDLHRPLPIKNRYVTAANDLKRKKISLVAFVGALCEELGNRRRQRTAETYRAALTSLLKFTGGDMPLKALTATLVGAYEGWLCERGVALNTSSFYMRVLWAIYNRAVVAGLVTNTLPFSEVYTGIGPTPKRALSLSAISAIKRLDLSRRPALAFARDMFLVGFYLRGMSFVDMAYLKAADMIGDHVIYNRRKTGQMLTVKWLPQIAEIVGRYPPNPTGRLLPILVDKGATDAEERRAYRSAASRVNRNLKKVGEMAGISGRLTMYAGRHSWATGAQSLGAPLSVISQGLGHDSERTTRIYLASLDVGVIDRMSALIASSL